MKVLLADDHDLVRDALCALMSQDQTLSLSCASTFDEAAEVITREGPFDVVLMDWTMPGMDGIDGLKRAKELNFNNPVAIISGSAPRDVADEALAAGAAGFLPKSMPEKSLVNAIRFMATGEQYVPVKYMTEKPAEPENPLADKLNEREMKVLEGLVKGFSNKEIARELDVQEVTVKLYVKTLFRKLDVRNRVQAALAGRDAGLG
jgi:DNA-binding NarL/FixJ family response regulator